jgi:sec-independent protein translocase protein TatB
VAPLLLDINAPEFVLLLVLAVILFGPERLPDLARKAARVLRYLRTVAGSAQQQLSKELGPEFENLDFRDLNPKTFVQKHLLDDVEPIIADVKSEVADLGKTIQSSSADTPESMNSTRDRSPGGPQEVVAATPARTVTPFDLEAT